MSDLRELLMHDGYSARVRLASGVECIVRRERRPVDSFVATYCTGPGAGIDETICAVSSSFLDDFFWVGADVLDIRNPLQERVPLRICFIPPQHPPGVLALIADAAAGDPGESGEVPQ